MKYKLLSLFLCLVILSGCTAPACPTVEVKGPQNQTSPLDSAGVTQEQQYAMLFDIENKISLQLDMPEAEIAKMQQDYERFDCNGGKSPVYRIADLYVTIETPQGQIYHFTIEEVGVRMKGNTSRTAFYNQEEGIYNLIHLKLSFQETFDDADYYGSDTKKWTDTALQARKDRTFATLEKLDLRWNRCDDSTYLREYFAYETYRQYGVLAPRTNLASFDWAGIHMGVYTINEPIDKLFLARNLPENALGGDLYKCGWAGSENASFRNANSVGIENDGEGKFYAYDLKTNKKTSNHQSLKNLIQILNGQLVTKETISSLLDIENYLAFSAVSYLLGNPDDMRSNYNNFYLYFREDDGKAIFIPYDYDRCMGITAHWNPTGDAVTNDNPFSKELNSGNGAQQNPLILYTIAAGGYFVEEYAQRLSEIISDDWYRYESFVKLYYTARANYGNLTRPGKALHNANGLKQSFDLNRTSDFSANENISVKKYLDAKLVTLNFYMERLEHYIDPNPSIPAIWYIRSDVTNWQNDSDYAMTEENGMVTLRFTAKKEIRLKVYNDHTGRWYGSECIGEDCAVPFESDGHTNIVLQAGTYRVTFHAESETIILEKE